MEKNPITIDIDEKKAKLGNLIYDADQNPLVDSTKMVELFRYIAPYIDEYKYFPNGYDILIGKIIELASVENDYQAFLNGFINPENTIKVFHAVIGGLK